MLALRVWHVAAHKQGGGLFRVPGARRSACLWLRDHRVRQLCARAIHKGLQCARAIKPLDHPQQAGGSMPFVGVDCVKQVGWLVEAHSMAVTKHVWLLPHVKHDEVLQGVVVVEQLGHKDIERRQGKLAAATNVQIRQGHA